jgi:hypothetical protein
MAKEGISFYTKSGDQVDIKVSDDKVFIESNEQQYVISRNLKSEQKTDRQTKLGVGNVYYLMGNWYVVEENDKYAVIMYVSANTRVQHPFFVDNSHKMLGRNDYSYVNIAHYDDIFLEDVYEHLKYFEYPDARGDGFYLISKDVLLQYDSNYRMGLKLASMNSCCQWLGSIDEKGIPYFTDFSGEASQNYWRIKPHQAYFGMAPCFNIDLSKIMVKDGFIVDLDGDKILLGSNAKKH